MAYTAASKFTESLYNEVLGEFSKNKCESSLLSKRGFPHYLNFVTTLNTHVLPDVPSRSRFHFKVKRPRPFLSPSKVDPAKYWAGDPMEIIVEEKQAWEHDLDDLLKYAQHVTKWSADNGLSTSKLKKNSDVKHLYCSGPYKEVAMHVANDPMPPFSNEKYNWFYTGGCITTTTLNQESFLLYPHRENMDALCVTDLRQQNTLSSENKNQASTYLSCFKGQRIHQIVENKGLVGVKQEKVCSLARIKCASGKSPSVQTRLEIQEKKGFFVSMDLGRLEGKQMCTTDSNRLLKLWDLTTSSCISSASVPPSDNKSNKSCWSFVKFNDKSSELFVLNKSTVLVKDLRMPLSNNCQEFSPSKIIDDCEDISLLLNSGGLPLVYVGTTHNLLSMDLRFGWNQRWTHLMLAPPMYGSLYCDEMNSEEVILLSSSIPDDSIAIVNTWKHGKPTSDSLPRSFQSTRDTLILAQSSGCYLGPSVKQRLDMATSGLAIVPLEDNNGFTAFKSTSIGDIFCQTFVSDPNPPDPTEAAYCKEEVDADIEAWKSWAQASHVISSKNVDLLCPVYSQNFVFNAIRKPLTGYVRDPVFDHINRWRNTFPPKKWFQLRSKENFPLEFDKTSYNWLLRDLRTHTDLMAGVLLQAWDSEIAHAEPDSSKKVKAWLDGVSTPNQDTSVDEDGLSSNGNMSPITSQSSPVPSRLMSSMFGGAEEHDDIFKVPASQPSKKRKRESIGF